MGHRRRFSLRRPRGAVANIQFFGFTDPGKQIVSVTLAGNTADVFGIDDVRFVSTDVPEPSTFSLAILFCGLVWVARRRKKTAA